MNEKIKIGFMGKKFIGKIEITLLDEQIGKAEALRQAINLLKPEEKNFPEI